MDTIDGGSGSDTVSYLSSPSLVSINLLTNTQNGGSSTGDTLNSIENIIGSIFNDDITGSAINNILNGWAGNDNLSGDAGDDTLYGGEGNDFLTGGIGADYLDGGPGIDTVSYITSAIGVSLNLALGQGFSGDAQGDFLLNI